MCEINVPTLKSKTFLYKSSPSCLKTYRNYASIDKGTNSYLRKYFLKRQHFCPSSDKYILYIVHYIELCWIWVSGTGTCSVLCWQAWENLILNLFLRTLLNQVGPGFPYNRLGAIYIQQYWRGLEGASSPLNYATIVTVNNNNN